MAKAAEEKHSKTESKKLSYKEKRELEQLDDEIKELQNSKDELTTKLSDSSLDYEEILKISTQLEITINALSEKEDRWVELSILNESYEHD